MTAREQTVEKFSQGLDEDQKQILFRAYDGENIFMTGEGGTGKTRVIKALTKMLNHMHKNVVVTATTGMAAYAIDGVTIHKASGIGMGNHKTFKELTNKIYYDKSKKALDFWKLCDVLIIEEVSMLSRKLLEELNDLAVHFRSVPGDKTPFPGMQLILVGDFAQLPPVFKDAKDDGYQGSKSASNPAKQYCFESHLWDQLFSDVQQILLTKVYRQTDPKFLKVLKNIRYGVFDEWTISYLKSLDRDFDLPEGIKPTILYSTNEEANKRNEEMLNEIDEKAAVFRSNDFSTLPPSYTKNINFDDLFSVPGDLRLKVGAQVIHMINQEEDEIFNGSVGVVSQINLTTGLVVVRFPYEFDGQTHYRDVRVKPFEFKIKEGEKLVHQRKQYPLKLGWAMTIHKSQGMTIRRLKADVSKCFAAGQLYVVLSRAETPETLQLTGFDMSKVKVDPLVVAFYRRLARNTDDDEEDEEKEKEEDDEENDNDEEGDAPPSKRPRLAIEDREFNDEDEVFWE